MLAVKITDNDETVEIVDLPGYAAKFADSSLNTWF